MEPIIQIQGLSKHFKGKTAVRRLDLTVPKGSIFALLGDNRSEERRVGKECRL